MDLVLANSKDPAERKVLEQFDEKTNVTFTFLLARSGPYCELVGLRNEARKSCTKTFSNRIHEWMLFLRDGQTPPGTNISKSNDKSPMEPPHMKKRNGFYHHMQPIRDEMRKATGTLSPRTTYAGILDICVAPDQYRVSALKYTPHAHISGLARVCLGGHKLIIPRGYKDPRVKVRFADFTTLAAECGLVDIPHDHPDSSNFYQERP